MELKSHYNWRLSCDQQMRIEGSGNMTPDYFYIILSKGKFFFSSVMKLGTSFFLEMRRN